eukprot:717625-Rhodomonas_salina.3
MACQEILFLCELMQKLGYGQKATVVFEDNQAASNNPCYEDREIYIAYVKSEDNVADMPGCQWQLWSCGCNGRAIMMIVLSVRGLPFINKPAAAVLTYVSRGLQPEHEQMFGIWAAVAEPENIVDKSEINLRITQA